MSKVSVRPRHAKRAPRPAHRFEALFAQALALEQGANATSPRRATRVAYVRYLQAALYMSRVLLDRAEREGRELLLEWPAEALEEPQPVTARLVLLPKHTR